MILLCIRKEESNMKYIPCGDSGFLRRRRYCGYDSGCYARSASTYSQIEVVTDSRDGTVCSKRAVDCFC